jgi:nucleotide-binding universal stress UspA family protein
LDQDSERLLRFAHQGAIRAHSNLHVVHAIATVDRKLDLNEKVLSEERDRAAQRIEDLQRRVGSRAQVRIVVGPIKDAILEAARSCDADVLIIRRNPPSGANGRLRDLTYVIVRDSPFPVLSV